MAILRIESLIFGVENLTMCIKFLNDWGLNKIDSNDEGAEFKTPDNQSIILRQASDPSLPLTEERNSTLREILWGVDSQISLDSIATELCKDREVHSDGNGTLHTMDDSQNCLGFKISDPKITDVSVSEVNLYEDINRVNKRGWPVDKARPLRIGHIVYSLEKEGNWEAAQFYVDRLKFRVTDRSETGGTFLRCEGSNFHHNLFLFHRQGSRRYYNHVAFEVNSFDEVMIGGNYMLKQGAVSVSGPGRHSLGSNIFWYFNNPCGGDIEYFSDMDRMDDNWETRYWDESPPYARWMMGEEEIKG